MHEQRAVHRTIVVLDVEGFGHPRRTNPHQLAVREGLYQAVGDAFRQAELPWTPDTHEDRGDGILILVPPEFPKTLFVEKLPSALVKALTKHNREHADEEGIRLRMSLHAGEVPYDPRGVYGRAVILAFRLVDAKLLKAALADSTGVLAINVAGLPSVPWSRRGRREGPEGPRRPRGPDGPGGLNVAARRDRHRSVRGGASPRRGKRTGPAPAGRAS
jgi:hypothetical protein